MRFPEWPHHYAFPPAVDESPHGLTASPASRAALGILFQPCDRWQWKLTPQWLTAELLPVLTPCCPRAAVSAQSLTYSCGKAEKGGGESCE
jgi:hypothetical protein